MSIWPFPAMSIWVAGGRRIPHCILYRNPFRLIMFLSQSPLPPSPDSTLEAAAKSSSLLAKQQLPFAGVTQRYGFPHSQFRHFSCDNKSPPDSTLPQSDQCVTALLSLGLPQSSQLSLISSCPEALDLGFITKWQLGFSRLGLGAALTPLLVQRVLEQSSRDGLEPDDLLRGVRAMRELGFGERTLSRVFEELPAATVNPLDVISRIKFLEGFGFRWVEINQICHLFPGILVLSIEGRIKPLFEELNVLNFNLEEVKRAVVGTPKLLFGMEVGELSRYVELLKSLKCRIPIKGKILENGLLKAAIDVKLRVDLLCRRGFIRREALKVIWQEPRSIIYQLDDLEEKIEFLLHDMGFSIDCLWEVPEYLGVNFQKQIVPRHRVIHYLRSQGALGFEVSVRMLIKPSRRKFYNMFVKPYPECEKLFGVPLTDVEVNTQRHSGLWQMFKPTKYPESIENRIECSYCGSKDLSL